MKHDPESNQQTEKLTNEECKEVKEMKKTNKRVASVFMVIWTLLTIIGGRGSEAALGVSVNTDSLGVNTKAGEPIQDLAPVTVANTANYKETLKIKIANEGANWHRGNDPGTDQYVLKFKEGTNPLEHLSTTNQFYKQSETGGGESTLTLAFQPPSETTSSSSDDIVVNLSSWPEDGYAYNQAGDFFYKIVAFEPYSNVDRSGSGDHVMTETYDCSMSIPLFSSIFISHTGLPQSNPRSYTNYSTILMTDAVWALPYATSEEITPAGLTTHTKRYARGYVVTNMNQSAWILRESLQTLSFDGVNVGYSWQTKMTYMRPWLIILN